jgi:hypothetical protein
MTLAAIHRLGNQFKGVWFMKVLPQFNRGVLRHATLLRVGIVAILALATSGLVAGNATAATKTSGSLTFTGALKGKLKLGPNSGCDASDNGVTLSSFTTTLPSKKFKTWSVTVYVTKLGHYKKFKFLTDSFVLGTSDLTGWVATNGSMTVIAHSGTVNATLDGHEGLATGTIHVTGTWICGS